MLHDYYDNSGGANGHYLGGFDRTPRIPPGYGPVLSQVLTAKSYSSTSGWFFHSGSCMVVKTRGSVNKASPKWQFLYCLSRFIVSRKAIAIIHD